MKTALLVLMCLSVTTAFAAEKKRTPSSIENPSIRVIKGPCLPTLDLHDGPSMEFHQRHDAFATSGLKLVSVIKVAEAGSIIECAYYYSR